MYMHPDMGRLLIRAKLVEAQSRMQPAHLLRSASLERQEEPLRTGAPLPIPTLIDQRPSRRASLAARPSVGWARAQDLDHAGGTSPQRDPTRAH